MVSEERADLFVLVRFLDRRRRLRGLVRLVNGLGRAGPRRTRVPRVFRLAVQGPALPHLGDFACKNGPFVTADERGARRARLTLRLPQAGELAQRDSHCADLPVQVQSRQSVVRLHC